MRNHESLKHRGKNFNKQQKTAFYVEEKMTASWKCFIAYEICFSIVNNFKKKKMLQKKRLQDVFCRRRRKMSSSRRVFAEKVLLNINKVPFYNYWTFSKSISDKCP